MPKNPTDEHADSVIAWVAFIHGTLLKTLLDNLAKDPNPAQTAREILKDLSGERDPCNDAIVAAALNDSATLTV